MTERREVVFVTQHFPPDKGGNAARIHDIATNLTDQDWRVTVLAPPPSYPPGEFERSWYRKRTDAMDDVAVHRLWAWQPQTEDPGMLQRLAYYLLFGIHAMCWLLWNVRRYDAVVTTTPPISTGAPGLLASVLGRPWVVDVRDRWIDASISLGYLEEGSLIERLSRRFQRLVLHTADCIAVTTPRLETALRDTYGDSLGEKTMVLPNGVDVGQFRPAHATADGETDHSQTADGDADRDQRDDERTEPTADERTGQPVDDRAEQPVDDRAEQPVDDRAEQPVDDRAGHNRSETGRPLQSQDDWSVADQSGERHATNGGSVAVGRERDRNDDASTREATSAKADGGEATIIYTGNLGSAQDLESVIRAMTHLSHDEAVLQLVGGGDVESELRELTDELGLGDRVSFAGVVPREEVPAFLTGATIGIAPLKDTDELAYAIPTKVYEYMASGLPAVVTGRGEIERFVDDSGGGVHAPNEPEAIARQLDELLDDDQYRRKLAECGREYVERNYSRAAIARRLDEELTRLVEPECDSAERDSAERTSAERTSAERDSAERDSAH